MSFVFNEDFSGKTKSFLLKEFDEKVSKSGDTMTGDLDIGNNKVITTADPTGEKHLCRKKYVDIQDAKKVSKSGDTMIWEIIILIILLLIIML